MFGICNAQRKSYDATDNIIVPGIKPVKEKRGRAEKGWSKFVVFLLTKSEEFGMIDYVTCAESNKEELFFMDDYYSDNQPELIHCKFCGEDYAATYKACPFCHTAPNGKKVGGSRSGRSSRAGNRVKTNTRGGGYGGARSPLSIVGIILSIILVVAAVIIVIVLVKTTLFHGEEAQPNSSTDISTSQQATDSAAGTPEGDQSAEGGTDTQVVAPDSVTLDQTAVSLNAGETLNLTATVAPSGWVGQIIWSTSDSNVATVDPSGVVSYVGAGTCSITASAAGVTASCQVTCNGADAGTAPATDPGATAGSSIVVTAYGNTQDGDFTLQLGEAVPFKATGGDGANYAWSVADPGIASVDPTTGSCTGLAEGKTTMTVTSGGESTTVTIRVKS